MTIDEAIEVLEITYKTGEMERYQDDFDAMKLGIEALKRIKTFRGIYTLGFSRKLPGEDQ